MSAGLMGVKLRFHVFLKKIKNPKNYMKWFYIQKHEKILKEK